MATTSNFGWETPDDTDLVKDGALAIRTLGNNIDTSLVDLKGGTTGQILSKNSNSDLDYTWINNDQGDITEVQAGTGISVASGTGPVPVITNTVATEFDAKGDLVVGTGADTFDKLTAGNNNDVLTVDSSTATGLKWAAPAASSPLTTKGDLYTYSTTNARLGVGANGETLVADSSATTGLRWQGNYAAGKNAIINGDFRVNQRAFSSATADGYGFDRWTAFMSNGTVTYSAQTFTAGTAPVAGYEAINFARLASTGQTLTDAYSIFSQRIEDVRTFANQTITVSFWAKAASGTPKVAVELQQNFGSGGSTTVNTYGGQITLSTSWARYSVTFTGATIVPSVSGKTIGTGSYLGLQLWTSAGANYNARTGSLGIQTATIDFWGVQAEAGSVATPFTTATGTLAGELAACQRYYFKVAGNNNHFFAGFNNSTTEAYSAIPLPVTMRVRPTTTVTSASTNLAVRISGGTNVACNGTTSIVGNTTQGLWFSTTVASGLTAGQGSGLINLGSAEAIEMSSEL